MSRGVRPQYPKKVNAASRRMGKSVSLSSSSTRVSDLKESFSIFVATWNVNGKPSCSMWVPIHKTYLIMCKFLSHGVFMFEHLLTWLSDDIWEALIQVPVHCKAIMLSLQECVEKIDSGSGRSGIAKASRYCGDWTSGVAYETLFPHSRFFFLCACVSQEMVPLNVTNVVLSDSVIHYSDQASILRSQFLFLIIHSNYVFEGRKFTNSPIFCECHSYAGGVKTCKQVEQKHRKSPQFHH